MSKLINLDSWKFRLLKISTFKNFDFFKFRFFKISIFENIGFWKYRFLFNFDFWKFPFCKIWIFENLDFWKFPFLKFLKISIFVNLGFWKIWFFNSKISKKITISTWEQNQPIIYFKKSHWIIFWKNSPKKSSRAISRFWKFIPCRAAESGGIVLPIWNTGGTLPD